MVDVISTKVSFLTLDVLLELSISITTGYKGLYFFIMFIKPAASFFADSIFVA